LPVFIKTTRSSKIEKNWRASERFLWFREFTAAWLRLWEKQCVKITLSFFFADPVLHAFNCSREIGATIVTFAYNVV